MDTHVAALWRARASKAGGVMRRWMLAAACVAALALLPLTSSAAGGGATRQTLTTSEDDGSNTFLVASCDRAAANAIFTLGSFTLAGPLNDSGLVYTSLLTGAAAGGVAPNQVAGTSSFLGTTTTAFITFTGQLNCSGPDAGRVTSVVGALHVFDAASGVTRECTLDYSPRDAVVTLDFANLTLTQSFSGALQPVR